MSSVEISYSLIIPSFNERDSLPEVIGDCKSISEYRKDLEIIIVDNGSDDGSSDFLAEHLSQSSAARLRFLVKDSNTGYGSGLKFGIKDAKAPVIVWTHADLQSDLWDVIRAIESYEMNLSTDSLIIKGKRLNRPISDTCISKALSLINWAINRVSLSDVNSQPNLIPRKVLDSLPSIPNDSTFELYIFTMALKKQLLIKRIDVRFPRRKFGIGSNQGFRRKISYSIDCLKVALRIRSQRDNY